MRWKGRRYVGPEAFFVAYFAVDRPSLTRTGLLLDEQVELHSHAWVLTCASWASASAMSAAR